MPPELPTPHEVAKQNALSLTRGFDVNGLDYYKCTTEYSFVDKDPEDLDLETEETIAPTMLLYYPARVVAEEQFVVALQTGQGDHVDDRVVRAIIESGASKDVLNQFVQYPLMATVVDFVREASREGVPLQERRDQMLRDCRAPLAAVAIRANMYGYQATLATPSFVWPWAAFAEMYEFVTNY